MRTDLNLRILSPSNMVFSGVIHSVHVPAILGEIEVFLNHTSLVSSLLPGFINVRHTDGRNEKHFVNGGYIEVNQNEVSLIVDDIISVDSLNKEYFKSKIDTMNLKLKNNVLDDNEYEKLTHSIEMYQQYAE